MKTVLLPLLTLASFGFVSAGVITNIGVSNKRLDRMDAALGCVSERTAYFVPRPSQFAECRVCHRR